MNPRASACSTLPTVITLPASLSLSRYRRTTSGCCLTDERFCLACLRSHWYPTLKPCWMPLTTHSTSRLSGWSASISCHAFTRSGVRTRQALLAICSAWRLTSSPAPALRHLQAKAQILSSCSSASFPPFLLTTHPCPPSILRFIYPPSP